MNKAVDIDWLAALSGWAAGEPLISQAWVFGSRAKGLPAESSDLDVALLLSPDDGEVLAEWVERAGPWRVSAQKVVGDQPKVDLQLAWPGNDEIVWPAVSDHGILFYEK